MVLMAYWEKWKMITPRECMMDACITATLINWFNSPLRRQSGKNCDCNKSVVVLCGFFNCIITNAFQELRKVEWNIFLDSCTYSVCNLRRIAKKIFYQRNLTAKRKVTKCTCNSLSLFLRWGVVDYVVLCFDPLIPRSGRVTLCV